MGQRTQMGINVKVKGYGEEFELREIFHYQWGGYNNTMFKHLYLFLDEMSSLMYSYKNFDFRTKELIETKGEIIQQAINKIESIEKNHSIIKDDYYEYNVDTMTNKEYYDILLNKCDCNDGQILVDITFDFDNLENCNIAWAFRKFSYSADFQETISKELLKNINDLPKHWNYDKESRLEKQFKYLIELIKLSTINNDTDEENQTGNYNPSRIKDKIIKLFS